ncbi:amino acid ABC transporter ATP-binding protein [Saccharothrix sp. MB29]|nr:amino acid ABC transporter ATP-binding protein [Saccharothrix sp. MB29]
MSALVSDVGTRTAAEAANLVKVYGKGDTAVRALDGVSVAFEAGRFTAIMGPSGSGKSTLMHCLAGLDNVDGGSVRIGGTEITSLNDKDLTKLRRDRVGFVFQAFNLFPHMTVLDNVTLASRVVHGVPRADAERSALELLARVGLADRARGYPEQLSGGQQQRVAIARALAHVPRLLLLDEITSALDPELVGEVLELVRELAGQGRTILMATHEMGFARQVADRVVFLDGGKLIESGPPAQVLGDPEHPRTRQFLKRIIDAGRL